MILWSLSALAQLLEFELCCASTDSRYRLQSRQTLTHVMITLSMLPPVLFSNRYVNVVATRLLPAFCECLDSYRAFTVLYEAERDGHWAQVAIHA